MMNKNAALGKTLRLILAIAVALGIWYYVDENGDNGAARTVSMTVSDIPVEYTGEPELTDAGLMLLHGADSETDETIDVTFEGA
ncbi:MAG: hypothetical protein IKN53_06105, partial [Oscillibacter sp.]|nr:hypothetical protein [Oscillibacter sp.]